MKMNRLILVAVAAVATSCAPRSETETEGASAVTPADTAAFSFEELRGELMQYVMYPCGEYFYYSQRLLSDGTVDIAIRSFGAIPNGEPPTLGSTYRNAQELADRFVDEHAEAFTREAYLELLAAESLGWETDDLEGGDNPLEGVIEGRRALIYDRLLGKCLRRAPWPDPRDPLGTNSR